MPRKRKKLFYKIGEVCEELGVEAHVLRYWEEEIPQLKIKKNSAGQRTYSNKDLDLLRRIYNLLYVEKYRMDGAIEALQRSRKVSAAEHNGKPPQEAPTSPAPTARRKNVAARIAEVKSDLQALLRRLDRD